MLFLLAAVVMLASCTEEYKKTKSGLVYKIFSDKKGPVAKKGQIIKFHVTQKVRDSVMYESYTSAPTYMMVDSTGPVYRPEEIFAMVRKGDSVVIVMLGDSINKKFGLPPYMKKEDKLTFTFKILEVFPDEQAFNADRMKEMDSQKAVQDKIFADYVAKKQNLQKTQLGTYVEIKTPGDGPQCDSGKLVSIRYTGKLMPSEKEFESNMNNPNAPPVDFLVGNDNIIRGWHDGIPLLKKGGKATLYIPGELAYGPQPPQIPGAKPYQPMIFDIEVIDVKDAPKGRQQPFSPPIDTTQGQR